MVDRTWHMETRILLQVKFQSDGGSLFESLPGWWWGRLHQYCVAHGLDSSFAWLKTSENPHVYNIIRQLNRLGNASTDVMLVSGQIEVEVWVWRAFSEDTTGVPLVKDFGYGYSMQVASS